MSNIIQLNSKIESSSSNIIIDNHSNSCCCYKIESDHQLMINDDKIQKEEEDDDENIIKKTREIDTLTDICISDNIAEVDLFSIINDNLPLYKLRADTLFTHNNSDWVEAPLYVDEDTIGELTSEQIKHTLDYFILSGSRVSQMTKTYYDIDAVNKLLEEKEKDLELAATIGKHLLDKGQDLETRIEILEEQLEKATDMVNQLRHEITLKDDLLTSFIELDNGSDELNFFKKDKEKGGNVDSLYKTITRLENENYLLKNDANYLKEETLELERKEQMLVDNCVNELVNTNKKLETIQEELRYKTRESSQQQDEITSLYNQIMDLQTKIKTLTIENSELKSLINISAATQGELATELLDLKSKYNDCFETLNSTRDELKVMRRKYTKKSESKMLKQEKQCLHAPWMTGNSFATELQFINLNQDKIAENYKQKRDSFDLVRKVREKLIKTVPQSNVDSCIPSDSEYESSMITSSSSLNLYPNTTTINLNNNDALLFVDHQRCDSHLSNFSASNWSESNNIMRSYLPDKLQIVKPIEGSQTLHHWQLLATPNLGCLIQPRPGIYIKGRDPNIDSNSSSSSSSLADHNVDISVLRRVNNQETSDLDETMNLSSIEDDDDNYDDDDEVWMNSSSKYAASNSKTKLRLPTIISSDSLDEANINSNERLTLKNLINTQIDEYIQKSSTTKPQSNNPYLEEIKNLSHKYYTTPLSGDNLKITNKYKIDLSNKLNELNILSNFNNDKQPDTPPPSPTNIEDAIELISTPPSSPVNYLNENKLKLLESNFVDEIFDRLSIFSFKSIILPNQCQTEDAKVLKPLALYSNNSQTLSNEQNKKETPPITPPPSPTLCASPTLSIPINTAFDEKNSAFIKVSTMNPLVNKSIDLSKLSGSLNLLKRDQRFV